jgi:hypothetical protein
VADLMSHIQSLAEKYKMTMVGMSEWNNADLDLEYAMKLDLHLITTDFVDYEEPKVKRFIAEFRNRFRNDPKQGKYAFEGYDLLVYFMNTLNSHGKNFIRYLPEIRYTGLQSGYNFKKRGEEGGYENEYAGIIRFKDYSIIRIR